MNVEIYIDDIIIKSSRMSDYASELKEMLDTLRSTDPKLNPTKCTFRVFLGKFLGHTISNEGLQANPKKVNTLARMRFSSTVKKVQTLTRRIAALARFFFR